MKLGNMTFKQIAEICETNICRECPFCKDRGSCILLDYIPSIQDLNMEINTNAEN